MPRNSPLNSAKKLPAKLRSLAGENWKPIPDYEEFYLVSDHGRVFSLRNELLLSPRTSNKYGHLAVALYKHGKLSREDWNVHVLVLVAFVGPRPEGMCCRHFPDRNTSNNKLTNLQWGTHQENMQDRDRDGNNRMIRHSDEEVIQAIEMRQQGKKLKEIATVFGVTDKCVSRWVSGHRRKTCGTRLLSR